MRVIQGASSPLGESTPLGAKVAIPLAMATNRTVLRQNGVENPVVYSVEYVQTMSMLARAIDSVPSLGYSTPSDWWS